jgi:lipopolysaccharide assembly outer membrane protein LptD (OstA)
VERPIRPPQGRLPVKNDTLPLVSDTLTIKKDTLNTPADSVNAKKGDIEYTIFYSADDSINSNLTSKIIRLYGNAKITYGQIVLEADQIEIDYENSTLTAHGHLDSLGRRVGFPIFKDGGQTYETKDMTYNFKTKKAKITEVVTKQGDGFLHGDAVFKNERNELFSVTNAYTTCNLPVPHFRILSHHSKAIPGDKIVTGPFYFEFNGVPTPLGFAFGMFPSKQKSASGLIIPKYGEEGRRGFFLKNGGYFFDINDYIKLTLTGDIYSKGSSAVYLNSTYRNRYKHSGNFNFTFTSNRLTDKIEDKNTSKDFRITWSHSPLTKGTGRFSASVNAATTTYNSNNLLGVNAFAQSTRIDNTTRKLSSNISYSKTFKGTPLSMGINLRHNQDLTTGRVDLPVPDLSFNVNNIYPFKHAGGNEFLENLSIRYTMTATNQLTNDLGLIGKKGGANSAPTDSIAPFTFANMPFFFQNAKKGVRHSIPLSTSVKVLKNFTLSPNITYDELWYFDKLQWAAVPNAKKGTSIVAVDTLKEFNRISNYSGSISMTTRLYGMYVSKNPDSKIKAIRHVVNPSVSYSYQPDFGNPKYDYFQTFENVYADSTTKVPVTVQKSRHEGFVYGSSRTGKSSALGFSINNNLEMKVKGKQDTVAKKISLLNTLSVSSSYNFLADSFKLAPFAFSANTNVLNDKININLSATVDPYQYLILNPDEQVINQVRVNRYAWANGFRLGQISSAGIAFGTNLSPKGKEKDKTTREKIGKSEMSPTDKEFLLKNPDAYLDFDVPWNLRMNYNADYSKNGHMKATVTQALRFNGDVSLSAKWKIGFNSGFDLQAKKLTLTSLSLSRELHCWQMSLNWVPFGKFQNYTFSIGIKSALLRDLKLDRQRSFFDN